MDRTLISWNVPNWITIMLMAAGGYAILAVVTRWLNPGGPSQSQGAGGF